MSCHFVIYFLDMINLTFDFKYCFLSMINTGVFFFLSLTQKTNNKIKKRNEFKKGQHGMKKNVS